MTLFYIDTTVFVYAFVNQDVLGDKSRKILDNIARGKITAVTSYITFDELFWALSKQFPRDTTLEYTKNFLQLPNLNFIVLNADIINQTHELLTTYQLHPRDAIHAVSAVVAGASSIISEDTDFQNIKEISFRKLSDY